MSIIYIVLPLALIFVSVGVYVFVRAVRAGQFDDMDTPGLRMLQDDEPAPRAPENGEDRAVDNLDGPAR